jgi:uncharacterized membrane protein
MCSVGALSPYIPYFVRSFLVLFSYFGISLAGETILYRLMGKKESLKATAEAVQEKHNMTLDELDIYIQKLVNIRVLSTTVALVAFTLAYLFSISGLIVLLSYLLTTLVFIFYVRMRGKIKTPKKFFLFDVLNGQGEGLQHRPYEPQSIADHAFGGSWERYREHLYGK